MSKKNNKNYGKKQGADPKKKGYNPGKGREDYEKPDGSKSPDEGRKMGKAGNPYEIYNTIPGLMDQVGKISTMQAIGSYSHLNRTVTDTDGFIFNAYFQAPGVMCIPWAPAYGKLSGESDPFNVAGRQVSSYIRSTSGRNSQYDTPDVMMYIMAVESLYTYFEWCKRVYGVAHMYYADNRYMPDTLLRAMKVDPDDIRNNLADFKAWLTTYAYKISQLPLPGDIPIVARHKWMCEHVYADDPMSKTQAYVFNPAYLLKWRVSDTTQATGLEYVALVPDGSVVAARSFRDITQFGDELLGALVVNGDVTIIAADIERAFKGHLAPVNDVPEDYRIALQYDPLVLQQIRNAVTLNADLLLYATIEQNTDINGGYLYYNDLAWINAWEPTTTTHEYAYASHLSTGILGFDSNDPTIPEVVEATRLHFAAQVPFNSLNTLGTPTDYTVGSEWVFDPVVYYKAPVSGELRWYEYPTSALLVRNNDAVGMYATNYDKYDTWIYNFHAFSNAPMRYFVTADGHFNTDGTFVPDSTVGGPYVDVPQLSNYVVPDYQWLRQLNEAVMLSLVKVPTIGQAFQY